MTEVEKEEEREKCRGGKKLKNMCNEKTCGV